MHFAMPPRKNSHPPPFSARSSRLPSFRRSRLKGVAIAAMFIGAFLFLMSRIFGGPEGIPAGTPPVVIITVLDPGIYTAAYIEDIKENRMEYARKHGYATFFPEITDYKVNGAPHSWSRIPAVRHAMSKWPHSTYFWSLEQNSLIMNPDYTIEDHVMSTKGLDKMMLRDLSVVPPNSVIKTFTHLKGEQIDFVLTQDEMGLAAGNFVIKRGDWAKFFLDTWFDPLYRSYNFQRAETHALEHIVQWHPTILSKLAIIPQRTLNSYHRGSGELSTYKGGDFVVNFAGCELVTIVDCEADAQPYSRQWRTIFNARR